MGYTYINQNTMTDVFIASISAGYFSLCSYAWYKSIKYSCETPLCAYNQHSKNLNTDMSLNERMASYEEYTKPVEGYETFIVRLDGRSFKQIITKYFKGPFDESFSNIMLETANKLFQEFSPTIVHVMSDEINLVFKNKCSKIQYYMSLENQNHYKHIFAGNISKILSTMASSASTNFYQNAKDHDFANTPVSFGAKLIRIPCNYEVINYLLWRSSDSYCNIVSMYATKYFKSSELLNITTKERVELLKNLEPSIDIETMPDYVKYGWFIKNQISTGTNSENIRFFRKYPTAKSFKIKYSHDLENTLLGDTWNQSEMTSELASELAPELASEVAPELASELAPELASEVAPESAPESAPTDNLPETYIE
jgi:tRNA(His) 5'-end guanylyltransferase